MLYPYAINDGIMDNHDAHVDSNGELVHAPDGLCLAQYGDPMDNETACNDWRIYNNATGIESALDLDGITELSLL